MYTEFAKSPKLIKNLAKASQAAAIIIRYTHTKVLYMQEPIMTEIIIID